MSENVSVKQVDPRLPMIESIMRGMVKEISTAKVGPYKDYLIGELAYYRLYRGDVMSNPRFN